MCLQLEAFGPKALIPSIAPRTSGSGGCRRYRSAHLRERRGVVAIAPCTSGSGGVSSLICSAALSSPMAKLASFSGAVVGLATRRGVWWSLLATVLSD